jgi:hypothetical protein
MKIQLGLVLVDQSKVRVCERSYFQMEKGNDEADLERCRNTWKAAAAWYKCASSSTSSVNEKPSAKKARIKKVPVTTQSDDDSEKESANDGKEPNMCDNTSTVLNEKGVDVLKKTTKTRDEKDETRVSGYCTFCKDNPCVWLVKEQDMMDYDDDKHDYLPLEDWPPHNDVRHKKI